VHRIGRTARAGKAGVAIAYCADDERAFLRDIERLTRQKLEVAPLPANFIVEAERIRVASKAAPTAHRHERRPHPAHDHRSAQPRRQRGRFRGRRAA